MIKKEETMMLEYVPKSINLSHNIPKRDWDLCSIFTVLLENIKKICYNNKVLRGFSSSSEKRIEYFMYVEKCHDYLGKAYRYLITLWKNEQKSKKILGDLFTYGSFTVLILSSVGMTVGFDIRVRTIIQIFGALFTIGSTALKVNLESSIIKTLNGVRGRAIDIGESFGIPIGIAGQIGSVVSLWGVLMSFLLRDLSVRLRAFSSDKR